jgi:hypothetical protein
MSRSGPRPHCWKVQGEIPHKQNLGWLRMKAQANYRGEVWMLSFEEYQRLWQDHWHQKGRGSEDYCLCREDAEGAWVWGNVVCIPRIEYLKRQRYYRSLYTTRI